MGKKREKWNLGNMNNFRGIGRERGRLHKVRNDRENVFASAKPRKKTTSAKPSPSLKNFSREKKNY